MANQLQKISALVQKLLQSGLFRSSIYVSVSKVFSSACNLIFMIYAVNLISKPENGQLQYYLGFLPVILAIAEFGLSTAIVKFLSPHTNDRRLIGIILSSSLWIKFISFLSLVTIGCFVFWIFNEDPFVIFLLITGGISISFLSFFESIFISFGAYYALAAWNPLTNITRLSVLYFTSQYSSTPPGYLDILTIFAVSPLFIIFLFFFIFDRKKLYWGANFSDIASGIKDLSFYNIWAFLASIFAIVSDKLEIFILKQYHPPEQVAVYGTALQLFAGFTIILATLNSMVLPGLSRLAGKPDFRIYLIRSVLVGTGIAILLMPGFFLAEPIFTILYQNKYNDSIPVFRILYPNYLLQLVFAPLGIALFAMGKPRILAILAFIRLAMGVLVDNLLIPEFGVSGAAIAFFLGQLISWLILTGYFWAIFWR